MSNYKYSVDLISGLRPKNNADFPLVRAHDVQSRDDGTRLDAELEMLRAGSAALYAGTVTTTDTGNGNVLGNLGVIIPLTQGAAYKVTFNGIDYKCVGSKEDIYPYLGNAHFLNDSREDTGEPFCLTFATNTTYLETTAAGSYTLAIYEATEGGLSVTEVSSPEEITADSPDGFYVVPGGESGDSGGGSTGGTPIHYYDSLDAVPADLPEGSFVAVPSKAENCVEIVTLDSDIPGTMTEDEGKLLEAAWNSDKPVVIRANIHSDYISNLMGITYIDLAVSRVNIGFVASISSVFVVFIRTGENTWTCDFQL